MEHFSFGTGLKSFVIIPGLSIGPVAPMGEAVAGLYASFNDEFTSYLIDRKEPAYEGMTIEDMADDYAQKMKELGLKDVCVFGASQGGQIALMLAIKYPELIKKAVFGSTAARLDESRHCPIADWIEYAKEKKGQELNESIADNCYSENTLSTRRDLILAVNGVITDEQMDQFIYKAEPIMDFDCYDRLGEIKCETLVIGSKGDKVFGPKPSEEIAEILGCGIYMYGEEYGHSVYDEAPDYIDRLYEFFSK